MGLFGSIISGIGSAISSIFGGGGGNGYSAQIQQVEEALGAIGQQQQALGAALAGLQQTFQPLPNGSWTGAGADRFFEEFQNRVVRNFGMLDGVLGIMQTHLQSAKSSLEEADRKSGGFWDTIGDIASAIFGGIY